MHRCNSEEVERVTREKLEEYISKKREIEELENKLIYDNSVDHDVILDYRKGYPQPQAIVGVDWSRVDRYRKRLAKLKEECTEVEEFVEGIEDSMTRRIFRMYYIEGASQEQVARSVGMERSSVSKKIDKFLKLSHNSQNSQL